MNPSLKQQTQQSRKDSFSEDEQKVLQQPNTTNIPSLVHKVNSDGALLVTDPSEISAKPNNPEHSINLTGGCLPSLQSLKPSATSFKGVSPIIAGQPGTHSVFFTSAKLVPQPINGGQVTKTTQPTTTGQTTFMVPQNTLKPLDKKAIRPNGGAHIQPSTILFRSGSTSQPIAALTNQQIGHNIKTVTNGQVISTHANLVFTQTLVKSNPSESTEHKFITPTNFIAATSDMVTTLVPASLQTVSVIKQPLYEGMSNKKETKPFTSITDILSSKDIKHIQNGDRGMTFDIYIYIFLCRVTNLFYANEDLNFGVLIVKLVNFLKICI